MPRNLAKKGHHNNRHENGLVGPGKRVSKSKSNGQLNGTAKSSPSTIDDPLPNASKSQPCTEPIAASTALESETSPDATATVNEVRWRKRDSESSSDFQDQKWDNVNGSAMNPSTRRSEPTTTRSRSIQDVSALQLASTILSSNPIGDTISLLIVLLALPSMVLTLVQALFASLTLIPPSTGISTPFLGLFDVFQGSAGSPSLTTMAVMDVICFAMWVGLWTWAQNFALDLAQIQIAVTFGCGNYGKGGSVNTVCFLLVLVLHSVRSSGLRRIIHTRLVPDSVLSHPRFAAISRYLPTESDFGEGPIPPSKVKSLFAVHIISQALMAFVRRRVAGTSSANRTTRRLDSEAFPSTTATLDSSAQDSVFNTAASSGTEQAPPPTPTVRDNKDKLLTAKKRRRQANQVKSRQPFWAALASTKVHVLREVEHSKDKVNPTTSQDYATRADVSECISVTTIEPRTIHFEAGTSTTLERGQEIQASESLKPFYVRINGAPWPHVTMDWADEDIAEDDFPTRLTGSIAGLAPDCNYTCSFMLEHSEELIASIMVRTPALLDADQPNTTAPAPVRQSARPNSPTTTLKTSIQAAEKARDEANDKRNKKRKNHQGALKRMDQDNDKAQNKLKSSGDDNRLRQKQLQFERNSSQHEETIATIGTQLKELETVPEEESVEYGKKKGLYDEHNRRLSETHKTLNEAKSQTNTELRDAKTDQTNTTGRKDRLVNKNTKLAAEQERLTQANIQNLSEKERKAMESAARDADQQRQIADWQRRISDMTAQLNTIKMQTQTTFREVEDVSSRTIGPLTPEGELPGTLPRGPRGFFYGNMQPSTFVPDPEASPFQSFAKPQPVMFGRPRSGTNQSTGGLSAISGADYDDPDPIPPMANNGDFDIAIAVNGRRGSGSSREKNNHSPAMPGPGVIGGGFKTSHKGSHSPGHMGIPSTSTW